MSQPSPSNPGGAIVIRSSTRMVRALYYVGFILLGLLFFWVNNDPSSPAELNYMFAIPVLLLVWTAWKHIVVRLTKLTLQGGKMRYESGLLSKLTRTMEMSKLQDIQVSQTLTQRILGIGDLRLETAGDSAPLVMKNVDRPQEVADYILESVRG